ncbi:MAG: tetratricopeptide repeat protein, partial [bacterium]|nr:tetratricopeptide repeat protein [bacterium]
LSRLHLIRGACLTSLGEPFEGLRSVRRSLRLNPRAMSAATAALAWTQEALGRREEAMEIWKRIRAAKPYSVRSRMKLAIFHESAGRHAEARQIAREILRINPRLTAEIVVGAPFGLEEGAQRRVQLLQRAGLP